MQVALHGRYRSGVDRHRTGVPAGEHHPVAGYTACRGWPATARARLAAYGTRVPGSAPAAAGPDVGWADGAEGWRLPSAPPAGPSGPRGTRAGPGRRRGDAPPSDGWGRSDPGPGTQPEPGARRR